MTDEVPDSPSPTPMDEENIFFNPDEEGEGVSEPKADTDAEVQEPPSQDSEEETVEDGSQATEAAGAEQADSQQEEESSEESEANKFWQSKYQRVETKLGRKPEEIADEEAELIKTFLDNPEYLQQFSDYLSNGQQAREADSPEEEGPKTLERPEPPEKPAGYSRYDALHDEESDSFKYRVQKEQYLEDLAEYNEKLANSVREEMQEREQIREKQTKAQQVKAQWYNYMTESEGLTDDQFVDFWEWRKKQQFEPEEIVTMFKAVRGLDAQTESADSQEREKQTKTRQEKAKKSPPAPGATAGAGNQAEAQGPKGKKDEEQLFFYE